MLGAIYPELTAKYATDLSRARAALERALATGTGIPFAVKNMKIKMDEVWNSGYLVRPMVKDEYMAAMAVLLDRVPEQTYVDTTQSDMDRNVERGGIGLSGVLIGVAIGYFVFGRKKGRKGK